MRRGLIVFLSAGELQERWAQRSCASLQDGGIAFVYYTCWLHCIIESNFHPPLPAIEQELDYEALVNTVQSLKDESTRTFRQASLIERLPLTSYVVRSRL